MAIHHLSKIMPSTVLVWTRQIWILSQWALRVCILQIWWVLLTTVWTQGHQCSTHNLRLPITSSWPRIIRTIKSIFEERLLKSPTINNNNIFRNQINKAKLVITPSNKLPMKTLPPDRVIIPLETQRLPKWTMWTIPNTILISSSIWHSKLIMITNLNSLWALRIPTHHIMRW